MSPKPLRTRQANALIIVRALMTGLGTLAAGLFVFTAFLELLVALFNFLGTLMAAEPIESAGDISDFLKWTAVGSMGVGGLLIIYGVIRQAKATRQETPAVAMPTYAQRQGTMPALPSPSERPPEW